MSGTSRIVVPVNEKQAEQCADEQQGCSDPRGQAFGEWTTDREAKEAGGVLSRDGIRRGSRPQMPQAQSG